MAGVKRSHLPTLSPIRIKYYRAVLAHALTSIGLKIRDVRAVLNCSELRQARDLIARGKKLNHQPHGPTQVVALRK